MSFQQGLSGLNSSAKALDVIGNNVANASTVGFKSSQAQFADVYASSLTGAGGNVAGIGVKVQQIAQQFTQGNIESSNNPLDLAINGQGFFRMLINNTPQYSRNGQFQVDKSGFIVNGQGAQLTGYMANAAGILSTGAPVALTINTADLPPVATTEINALLNIDSRGLIPTNPLFDAGDPTSYNNATSVNVYDSLGNPHVLQTFYVKEAASTWKVFLANDGVEVTALGASASIEANAGAKLLAAVVPFDAAAAVAYAAAADPLAVAYGATLVPPTTPLTDAAMSAAALAAGAVAGATPASILAAISAVIPANRVTTLTFDTVGSLDAATFALQPLNISLPVYPDTGSITPMLATLSFVGTTQFGSSFSVNSLNQDGYTSGRLSGFNTGTDGTILARYTNGQSHVLAQVVLGNFTNPNGLSPLGNNAWSETAASGAPLVSTPGSGSLGVLQASAVENANVDLTQELVNMITAQRVYQANAQTIKTQDSVLQTLVNLR